MPPTEYHFNPDFLSVLITHINNKHLSPIYTINLNQKYSMEYILVIVNAISTISYNKYKLPDDVSQVLNQSIYAKYSRTSLKQLIRTQIITNTDHEHFLNTYVVIGNDIPVIIKELTVCV